MILKILYIMALLSVMMIIDMFLNLVKYSDNISNPVEECQKKYWHDRDNQEIFNQKVSQCYKEKHR